MTREDIEPQWSEEIEKSKIVYENLICRNRSIITKNVQTYQTFIFGFWGKMMRPVSLDLQLEFGQKIEKGSKAR